MCLSYQLCSEMCLFKISKYSLDNQTQEKQQFYCNHVGNGITNNDYKFMEKYSKNEAPIRAAQENDVNGYAKLSCLLFGDKTYCVLREGYQQVQF